MSTRNFRPRESVCAIVIPGIVGLLAAFGLLAAVGCGGGASTPDASSAESDGVVGAPAVADGSPADAGGNPDSGNASRARSSRGRDEVYVDETGQKWFGDVPYDVFFDDPIAVAMRGTPAVPVDSSAGPVSGATESPPVVSDPSDSVPETRSPEPANVPGTLPTTGSETATAAAGARWSDLLPIEDLNEEVTNIRNFLNETVQTTGSYNSSMLMIPQKAATLGVLAGVALEHPTRIGWKDRAAYVRDIARRMNEAPLQRGPKDQRRLLALFESLAEILSGSRPTDLPDPPTKSSFSDVSEMRLVMMRMEEAETRLRTEAGSEGALTKNRSMVKHEAAILATMAHLVTRPDYGFADDGEFVKFGQTVVDAAMAIHTAADAPDFSAYQVSLSKISTTCQACHSQYKND